MSLTTLTRVLCKQSGMEIIILSFLSIVDSYYFLVQNFHLCALNLGTVCETCFQAFHHCECLATTPFNFFTGTKTQTGV